MFFLRNQRFWVISPLSFLYKVSYSALEERIGPKTCIFIAKKWLWKYNPNLPELLSSRGSAPPLFPLDRNVQRSPPRLLSLYRFWWVNNTNLKQKTRVPHMETHSVHSKASLGKTNLSFSAAWQANSHLSGPHQMPPQWDFSGFPRSN